MSTTQQCYRNKPSKTFAYDPKWWTPSGKRFQCQVHLDPEPDGGFSVYAVTLPGVVSQGDTKEEAIKNITEALKGTLLSYMESGQKIPWLKEAKEATQGDQWIVVHV